MNIFWLHSDPVKCVKAHCDKHVISQLKEYSQILGEVMKFYGHDEDYLRSGYPDHPQTKWAAESWENWYELYKLEILLYKEKKHRYGGGHKSFEEGVEPIDPFEVDIPRNGFTSRVETVKGCPSQDTVFETYRLYYNDFKHWDMSWTNRQVPSWYESST